MRPLVKKHSKGYVPNGGNGMIGGRWANTTRLAYKDINVSDLTNSISDTDKAEACLKWVTDRIGETFRVEAYFDCGYDHSVGVPEYCEMNESLDPDKSVFEAFDCPMLTLKEKSDVMDALADICDDEDGYELYEIDYPDE